VRVYGVGRVAASAFPRGLTIATDLPLYVFGDVNRVQVVDSVVEPHAAESFTTADWNVSSTNTSAPPHPDRMATRTRTLIRQRPRLITRTLNSR